MIFGKQSHVLKTDKKRLYIATGNAVYKARCGTWWRIGRVEAFRPEGRGFESRSNRHVETFGKSLTRSCLWGFGVKLRNSIRAMSGALMSSSGLEKAL